MSRRRLAWLSIPVSLLALSGVQGAGAQQPAGPTGPVVLPARQVSTDLRPGRAYNQPPLAIDPTDERTLVIAGANYNAGECLNFLSLDGGATWRPCPGWSSATSRTAGGS